MPAADLFEIAAELLVQSREALDPGAPERRFVSVGRPFVDCPEQLAVGIIAPGAREERTGAFASPMAIEAACLSVAVVDFVVVLSRCAPAPKSDGGPPSSAQINAWAQGLYAQGWTLWNGLRNRRLSDVLYPAREDHRTAVVGPLVPLNPEGGAGGWEIVVSVEIDPDPALGL
jgi:hypothetical protein